MESSPGPTPDPAAADRARDRFAVWLETVAEPDRAALDRLCAGDPEHAAWFRRWWGELAAIGELGSTADGLPAETDVPDATESDAPLDVGATVGPYRLVRELGRGGQATVWLAVDERDRGEVALKLMPTPVAGARDRLTRFQREARLTARARHASLCAVHEAGAARGVFYLAMERVDGNTLADRIAAARTAGAAPIALPGDGDPSRRVAACFARIAEALHAAHEVGLIHRDMKPGNVMVRADGSPVVCDFGLARDIEDIELLTRTGDLLGTPAYMSPEQIAAQRIPLDRRSDVFSLGATLYEALTLRRPFEAPTMDRLFQAILSSEPSAPHRLVRGIPADLSVVVATCLEKDRNRRYATAADLAADLRSVARRGAIRARPAGALRRAVRWIRRNPLPSAVLATLALATGVVGGFAVQTARANQRFELVRTIPALERARRAAVDLFPAWPDRLADLQAWRIAHGEPIAAQQRTVAAALTALGDAPAADVDRFLRATLIELAAELEAFATDPAAGGLADVDARIDWARSVAARSVDAHRAAWDEVRAAVAADPRYAGLDLAPQLGLVPLGRNPVTGLFEFAHLRSGRPAWREPDRGFVTIDDDAGIVFVLLPPGALPDGTPLPSFLIAAHEVSKGQWQRLTGGVEAGVYEVGVVHDGELTTARHPVESQSWTRCRDVLARHALRLPSDAEWEYAARAGRVDAGPSVAELRASRANLGGLDGAVRSADGFAGPAPVGSSAPNGFGVFDAFGNVFEWCADAADGEAGRSELGETYRHVRGGSFKTAVSSERPEPTRLWIRPFFRERTRDDQLGLRAARSLLPTSAAIRR